jgi:hypothetical protein
MEKIWEDVDSYNIGDEFINDFPKPEDWEISIFTSLEYWMKSEWAPNAGVVSDEGFEDAFKTVSMYLKAQGYLV